MRPEEVIKALGDSLDVREVLWSMIYRGKVEITEGFSLRLAPYLDAVV